MSLLSSSLLYSVPATDIVCNQLVGVKQVTELKERVVLNSLYGKTKMRKNMKISKKRSVPKWSGASKKDRFYSC